MTHWLAVHVEFTRWVTWRVLPTRKSAGKVKAGPTEQPTPRGGTSRWLLHDVYIYSISEICGLKQDDAFETGWTVFFIALEGTWYIRSQSLQRRESKVNTRVLLLSVRTEIVRNYSSEFAIRLKTRTTTWEQSRNITIWDSTALNKTVLRFFSTVQISKRNRHGVIVWYYAKHTLTISLIR